MHRIRTTHDRLCRTPARAGAWFAVAALVVGGLTPAPVVAQQVRADPPSRTAVSCDVIEGEDVARSRTVTSALRAHVTGLHLTPTSGQAGGGTQVNMRGITSMRRSPPLVFIDGLKIGDTFGEGPDVGMLDQLNPDDVLLIEVFRGPSATTLYGTDASGGVIRVYTKRGNARAEVLSDPRAQCVP